MTSHLSNEAGIISIKSKVVKAKQVDQVVEGDNHHQQRVSKAAHLPSNPSFHEGVAGVVKIDSSECTIDETRVLSMDSTHLCLQMTTVHSTWDVTKKWRMRRIWPQILITGSIHG